MVTPEPGALMAGMATLVTVYQSPDFDCLLNAISRYADGMKTIQCGMVHSLRFAFAFGVLLAGTLALAHDSVYEEVARDFAGETSPALVSVGFASGFPTYQATTIAVGVQMELVHFQLKGGYTAAGAYIGGQFRLYPPIPAPIPLYVGVGGGVYGSNNSFHVAVGTHIPVTEHIRLDLEVGAANVPLLNERSWAPHIAAGISYAFAIDASSARSSSAAASRTVNEARQATVGSCEQSDPNLNLVAGVVQATIDGMVVNARATYGTTFTDLQYRYNIVNVATNANQADVTIDYAGSVRNRLGGGVESATGEAGVALHWTGCGWRAGEVWF